jgi:hypothetical protein
MAMFGESTDRTRRRTRTGILVPLLFCLALGGCGELGTGAPPVTISGEVRDTVTDVGIASVELYQGDTLLASPHMTDSAGFFSAVVFPILEDTLYCRKPGYQTKAVVLRNVTVNLSGLVIYMSPSPNP